MTHVDATATLDSLRLFEFRFLKTHSFYLDDCELVCKMRGNSRVFCFYKPFLITKLPCFNNTGAFALSFGLKAKTVSTIRLKESRKEDKIWQK